MANKIEFQIQGSAQKPYTVNIWHDEDTIIDARCSCPAGKRGGLICKHIMSLFAGDIENLVSENYNDVEILFLYTSETPVSELYLDFVEEKIQSRKTKISKNIRSILTEYLTKRAEQAAKKEEEERKRMKDEGAFFTISITPEKIKNTLIRIAGEKKIEIDTSKNYIEIFNAMTRKLKNK